MPAKKINNPSKITTAHEYLEAITNSNLSAQSKKIKYFQAAQAIIRELIVQHEKGIIIKDLNLKNIQIKLDNDKINGIRFQEHAFDHAFQPYWPAEYYGRSPKITNRSNIHCLGFQLSKYEPLKEIAEEMQNYVYPEKRITLNDALFIINDKLKKLSNSSHENATFHKPTTSNSLNSNVISMVRSVRPEKPTGISIPAAQNIPEKLPDNYHRTTPIRILKPIDLIEIENVFRPEFKAQAEVKKSKVKEIINALKFRILQPKKSKLSNMFETDKFTDLMQEDIRPNTPIDQNILHNPLEYSIVESQQLVQAVDIIPPEEDSRKSQHPHK